MAWTHIQSATNSADSAATVSKAFTTSNLLSGSKIIAAVTSYAAVTTSVHDGASNAMTQIGADVQGNTNVSLWAMDVPAGDVGTKPTITATATGATAMGIVIQEVSGLLAGNTTAMCDGTLAFIHGSSSSPSTPTYASTAPNEYLVSVYGDGEASTTTWTGPGSPWTSDPGQNATFIVNTGISYKNSTGGTESDGYTINHTEGWVVLMVAFQLPGTDSSPAYASSASDLGNGTGSWTNPTHAEGSADASYATWTAP